MFSVTNNECVGFDSKWKVKRVFSEGSSQTTEYALADICTNTTTNSDAETQTNNDINKPEKTDVDMQKLADWLTKVFPSVHKELTESINSKAFNGYYSFEDNASADARLVQTLNVCVDNGDGDTAARVIALSWNSTGNTVAVSCAHFHKTWCHHSGQVNFHTFDRNDKLSNIPNKKLTTSACVSMLRFHPTLPYIIACGTYSGEILVWNIQQDGENIVTKLIGHEEGVTEMAWMHDLDDAKTLLLATSSLDGCLCLWNFSLTLLSLVIKQKYKIKSPVLAKIQRTSGVPEKISKKIVRGILSFDFSKYVPDMFVAAVEGGLIVQCSMSGATYLKDSTKEVPVSDPVFKYYEPHEGEVNTVRFSPNRPDMFMSTASDAEVRIYIVGQDAPARIIFLEKPLNQVCWVPYQETLVIGCGERGVVEIFNLISGRPIPNVTSENIVPTYLLQMEINKQRCTTVAIGNDKGELQIWNIPWGPFSVQKV